MNERTELVVFVVLALVGAGIYGAIGVSDRVVDVPVAQGKADVRETAETFLRSRGYNVSGYTANTVFESHPETATYLQRKLPLDRVSAASRTYSVYVWEVRFYKPLTQTQFYVDVDPSTGKVVGFTRIVPDEAPGGRLSREAARSKAREFLTERGYDLSAYEPIRNASTDQPNRRDHTFAWRKRGGGVAGAPLEVSVEIHGERVGSYSETLDIPDGFTHEFESVQNRNDLFGTLSLLLGVLIGLVAFGFGVRYYRRDQFDVRKAAIVGGIFAVVMFGQRLNTLPDALHRIPTTTTPLQYLGRILIGGAVISVLLGVAVGVLFGAGIRIARDHLDKSLIGNAEPRRTIRILEYSTVRGFCAGWITLGFVTLFYWIGAQYFDFWLPAGTAYTNAMSTFVPAFTALWIGFFAAVLEELLFRVVGISVGRRYLRYGAVAVVLTAMIWAFGHQQYVVLPPYARFVELTIVGVFWGWLFLRYDFVTVLAAHFTLNASVVAVPMLLTDHPFVVANGVVGMVIAGLPLLVSAGTAGYRRRAPGRLERFLTPPRADPDAVLELLETTDEHVLTTGEVASGLDVPRDAVRPPLQELHEQGEVETKQVRGGEAVWWT